MEKLYIHDSAVKISLLSFHVKISRWPFHRFQNNKHNNTWPPNRRILSSCEDGANNWLKRQKGISIHYYDLLFYQFSLPPIGNIWRRHCSCMLLQNTQSIIKLNIIKIRNILWWICFMLSSLSYQIILIYKIWKNGQRHVVNLG